MITTMHRLKADTSGKRLRQLADATLGVSCRQGFERSQAVGAARDMGVAGGTICPNAENKEALFMLWQVVFNVAGHTGYEFHPRWLMNTSLRYFLKTPTNHVMHHEKMRGNYGLYFNIWDRLMGTNHADYEARFREVTSRPKPEAAR